MRAWYRLSATQVANARRPGKYHDGGGLLLHVRSPDARQWVFRYQRHGRERAMGLGSLRTVTLALARTLAGQAREQLARGLDPVDARKAAVAEQQAARAKRITFEECAKEFHAINLTRWTNQKHRDEWISSLRRYAFPVIGRLLVDAVDASLVHKVLLPMVPDKMVTAAHVRGRIEIVLDYAKASGRRSGDNPASKAIIGHMLPLQSQKSNVTHMPALPFAKVPLLMPVLRGTEGTAARLLETIALTVMRHTAVRFAQFDEFDLAARVWVLPRARVKALGRDHRIPLGDRTVEIVRDLRASTDSKFVFAGADDPSKPVGKNEANKVLTDLLKTIGHNQHAVPHGFRSALKDWAHEGEREYPFEVIEQTLGHAIKGEVERAYRRGDLFARRKVLMSDWEAFCFGGEPAGNVVALRSGSHG
jgi:integrase